MSKPARGTKRVCPSCGARFYDLGRSPIVCPSCQSVYQMAPTRRAERAAPAPVTVKKPEVVKAPAPVLKPRPEVVSLDEADETGSDIPVEEEEIVDLGDDDTEIPAAEDDDTTFLEEEEEGETDVKGIVGGGQAEET
ncbi:MAG: TIGR02300 family protein [Alphaproteobacteria bacterium]|nr:TIGR02300 family protein [Alphaproteobacteria bacterium]